MKRLASVVIMLAALLPGDLAAAPPCKPAGSVAGRWAWFYAGGSFKRVRPREWVEWTAAGKRTYREIGRSERHVALLDEVRNKEVRLYASSLLAWDPSGPRWVFL